MEQLAQLIKDLCLMAIGFGKMFVDSVITFKDSFDSIFVAIFVIIVIVFVPKKLFR